MFQKRPSLFKKLEKPVFEQMNFEQMIHLPLLTNFKISKYLEQANVAQSHGWFQNQLHHTIKVPDLRIYIKLTLTNFIINLCKWL
jgi:hypothetical protein